MSTDERLLRLENADSTIADLLAQAKSQTDILIDLARRTDERLDKIHLPELPNALYQVLSFSGT